MICRPRACAIELEIMVWWAPESTIANANEVPTPSLITGCLLSQIRACLASWRPIFTAQSGMGLKVGISDTNMGPLPTMGWAMLGVSGSTYGCPAPPIGAVAKPGNVYSTGDYIGSCPEVTGSYPEAAGSYPVAAGTGG